tara:strand:+ start:1451 stop:1603 length:153 start_codon:yes stop_codon:yes gene_type:complete
MFRNLPADHRERIIALVFSILAGTALYLALASVPMLTVGIDWNITETIAP